MRFSCRNTRTKSGQKKSKYLHTKNNSWHFIYETHKIEVKKQGRSRKRKRKEKESLHLKPAESYVVEENRLIKLYYTFPVYFRLAVITHSPFKIEIKISITVYIHVS